MINLQRIWWSIKRQVANTLSTTPNNVTQVTLKGEMAKRQNDIDRKYRNYKSQWVVVFKTSYSGTKVEKN